MNTDAKTYQRKVQHLREALKRAGIKMTHQRLEIFLETTGSGNHPDAETIFRGVRERIPTISLDTVYRTLWMLLDLDLIRALGPLRERVRFDGNTSPHHHFICLKCGAAHDFQSEQFDLLEPPVSVRALGETKRVQVELEGLCSFCLREERRDKRGKTTRKETMP
jgi:Fur family transcriptional regulator, peroxide stress response regulator